MGTSQRAPTQSQEVQPIAPRLPLLHKQHEIKPSTRQNDAIKTCGKHEMFAVAVDITQPVVSYSKLFL